MTINPAKAARLLAALMVAAGWVAGYSNLHAQRADSAAADSARRMLEQVERFGNFAYMPLGADRAAKEAEAKGAYLLPPLERVLEAAVNHAPILDETQALIEKNTWQIKRTRLNWTDIFSFAGTAQWTSRPIALGANIQDVNQLTVAGTWVSAQFNLRFSLYDLLSQRAQTGVWEKEREITVHVKRKQELETRVYITGIYYKLELATNILFNKRKAARIAEAHLKFAELEFKQGDIDLREYNRVSLIYTDADAEYQIALNEFKDKYTQLEQLCGVSLDELR